MLQIEKGQDIKQELIQKYKTIIHKVKIREHIELISQMVGRVGM